MSESWQRLARWLATSVGVVAGLWAIMSASDALDTEGARTGAYAKECVERQTMLLHHDELAATLVSLRALAADLEQRLPAHLDNDVLAAALRTDADAAHLEIDGLAWHAEREREGFYGQRRLDVEAHGTAPALREFLDALMRARNLRVISALTLAPLPEVGQVQVTLHVDYFRYVEDTP